MKKLISLLSLVFCFVGAALAGNYPDRADYLWITVPNHSDWLYKQGEKAVIDVQFYKYGIPRDATVTYEIGTDMLPSDSKGSVKMKNGHCTIDMGTSRKPGFRDLRLSAEVDGKTYTHHIKVGFDVDKIEPFTKMPADFDEFWESNLKELSKFPLQYSMEEASEYSTDKMDCYLVKLMLNRNQSVYGYLSIPKNAQKGSCPVVLCPPGAGIKTIKQPFRKKYYVEEGNCIRLETEIHGLDPRMSDAKFAEISAAFGSSENGYFAAGIDNRERYYMKRVCLSLVRAIDFLTSFPEWDGKNVIVQGGSQGGALSIIAAGLDGRVTECIANHPALSDMAGYSEEGRTGGYPHFNRTPGLLNECSIETLAYYDVVNFARRVKCPVRMTWGYNDNTCPPTTSYAVWNVLSCPKDALITPINEHWTSEDTEYGHFVWMEEHLIK